MKRRILNLGAGTQSSVLLIMADRGDIEPVECAIFADTHNEPAEVYDHLNWLSERVKTPIMRISEGNLQADAMVYQKSHHDVAGRYASIPMYTKRGMQPRQCTKYYKVLPIHRWIRKNILKLGPRESVPLETKVVHVFGISFDERERMATPRVSYVEHEYPLVDRKLRRHTVIELAEKWFPGHKFPRSACKVCPYRNDDEWLDLTQEEFEEACRFDDAMREADIAAGGGGVFVHRSRIPLRVVKLERGNQLFDGVADNECEGMCGV